MLTRILTIIETPLVPKVCVVFAILILAAFGLTLAGPLVQPDGRLRDGLGQLYGHDFALFWNAGRAVLDIGPSAPWQEGPFLQNLSHYYPDHGLTAATARFNYPPVILLVLVPLASLPVTLAFPLMMAGGTLFCLFALWRIVPDVRTPLIALGTPMLLQVVIYGQWSLWLAGFLACALLPLSRGQGPAPWASSMLVMKPVVGIPLLPAYLVSENGWRALAISALLAAAMVATSLVLFGFAPWRAYVDAMPESGRILLSDGSHIIRHSATFGSALLLYGTAPELARTMQWLFSAAILLFAARIMSTCARGDLKAAFIAAATPLAAPYFMTYDLALLLPAAAFYIRDARLYGYRPGDKLIMTACAILPFFVNGIQDHLALPLGFAVSVVAFLMVTTRTLRSASEHEGRTERNEQKTDRMIPAKRLL